MDNSLLAVRDINHKYIVVESIWDRERCFVAQEISEWRVDELEDWQRDLIEKIRVGVELKDDDIVKAMGC